MWLGSHVLPCSWEAVCTLLCGIYKKDLRAKHVFQVHQSFVALRLCSAHQTSESQRPGPD